MNDKILDDAFLQPNIFSDFFPEAETILWEGKPSPKYHSTMFEGNKKNRNDIIQTGLLAFGLFITILFNFLLDSPIPSNSILFFFILFCFFLATITLFLFIYAEYQMFVLKKNTKYAITDSWILFSKHDSWNHRIGKIGFFEIDSYSIIFDKNNLKTFSLKINNSTYSLKSYNFESGKERKNLTLELIENHERVEELLQKGMEKHKKLSKA